MGAQQLTTSNGPKGLLERILEPNPGFRIYHFAMRRSESQMFRKHTQLGVIIFSKPSIDPKLLTFPTVGLVAPGRSGMTDHKSGEAILRILPLLAVYSVHAAHIGDPKAAG
jgi:hypothetical protein